ncbi:SDR family NAD(P)-dependent oxidoreductase, partial [Salmonella enterica]|uniref:SDR family NAD(P)-dependent oxidoreductase n=1 Tax=Salmonella enterica TaxID=28901 RepID=UPI003CEEA53E
TDDISSFEGGQAVVRQAIDTFGGLDVVINNAGILRDRMLFSMTEGEWDAVIKVHLKGTFSTSHHASVYWRER